MACEQVDWKAEENRPVKPQLLGTKVYKEYAVKDVVDYIDWNPFFQVGVCISHALWREILTACLNLLSPSCIHPRTLSLACLLACFCSLTRAFTLLLTHSVALLLCPPDVHTGGTMHTSPDLQLHSLSYAQSGPTVTLKPHFGHDSAYCLTCKDSAITCPSSTMALPSPLPRCQCHHGKGLGNARPLSPFNSKDSVYTLTISHRHGSCGGATPTEATPRFSMTRMWGLKPGSCLMRPRACCRYAITLSSTCCVCFGACCCPQDWQLYIQHQGQQDNSSILWWQGYD